MRARLLTLLSVCGIPVVVAADPAMRTRELGDARARERATVEITVDARCTGPRTTRVTVSPWNTSLRQGDSVAWVINSAANTDSIVIAPKNSSTWPFLATPPYRGRKNAPARATRMRPGARGRYSYDISLVCRAGATADTVRIDPDIIIE
ncbi:MAG: hypothetical protein V4617_14185 [Gemmatimonadota bacterium]